MPDFVLDLYAPYPDKRIDDLLAFLRDHLEQLGDSFLLGQTAFDFAQTVLVNFQSLQQTVTNQSTTLAALQQSVSDLQTTVSAQGNDITTLQTQVADLETRVSNLENPPPAA